MFCHVVRLVDGVLEGAGRRGTVCHDHSPKYESALRTSFGYIKLLDGGSSRWTSGAYRRNGVTQLDELRFEDSSSSAGLQLADLVVGVVRWTAVQAVRGVQSEFAPSHLGLQLIARLLGDNPAYARIVASEPAKFALIDALVRGVPGGTASRAGH